MAIEDYEKDKQRKRSERLPWPVAARIVLVLGVTPVVYGLGYGISWLFGRSAVPAISVDVRPTMSPNPNRSTIQIKGLELTFQ